MGTNKKDSLWVRLKRAVRKINFIPQWGDGGFVSDKIIEIRGNKHTNDTSFVVRDSTVIPKARQ